MVQALTYQGYKYQGCGCHCKPEALHDFNLRRRPANEAPCSMRKHRERPTGNLTMRQDTLSNYITRS